MPLLVRVAAFLFHSFDPYHSTKASVPVTAPYAEDESRLKRWRCPLGFSYKSKRYQKSCALL